MVNLGLDPVLVDLFNAGIGNGHLFLPGSLESISRLVGDGCNVYILLVPGPEPGTGVFLVTLSGWVVVELDDQIECIIAAAEGVVHRMFFTS